MQEAIGRGAEVERFFRAVMQTAQVPFVEKAGAVTVELSLETPRGCAKPWAAMNCSPGSLTYRWRRARFIWAAPV